MDVGRFRKHESLSGFSNAGIEKAETGNQRGSETRRPASAPLPEHRFGRDTVLAASHRGSVRPDWKRVPQPNQDGQSVSVTFGLRRSMASSDELTKMSRQSL